MVNTFTLIFQKCLIVGFYLFQYFKYIQIKRYDDSLSLKLGFRAWLEVVLLLGLNAGFMVFPATVDSERVLIGLGIVLMLITYIHTYRYVAVGKKLVFAKQKAFDIRKVSRKSYEGGKLTLIINSTPVKVIYPVADMNVVMERLSGRKPRKNRR